MTASQGELVLIDSVGQSGDNNRPPDTTPATGQGVTVTIANRSATAPTTAKIAATASANAVPAGAGTTGSGATATSSPVNHTFETKSYKDYFGVRNDRSAAVTVDISDQVMTIESKWERSIKIDGCNSTGAVAKDPEGREIARLIAACGAQVWWFKADGTIELASSN